MWKIDFLLFLPPPQQKNFFVIFDWQCQKNSFFEFFKKSKNLVDFDVKNDFFGKKRKILMKMRDHLYQGGSKSSGTDRQKFRDTTPSDFAFFGVFNTKNAKSDSGSVLEFLSVDPELLSICPQTFVPLPDTFRGSIPLAVEMFLSFLKIFYLCRIRVIAANLVIF